ncbi:MAG: hypothetical protein FVQ81_01805 [Candidatus Glassbacteria bacterium]|nr:hypothetical protein [Candidatus Glassbacteria bacterium]
MTLPSGVRKVILPLAILFIFAAAWFGLYRPELEKISEYRKQPAANRARIEQLVRQMNYYDPPIAEEREEWRRLEEQIHRRLPAAKQMSGLYALLSRLAVGRELQNFTRQELAGTDTTYATDGIPRRGFDIQLNFECDYAGLKGYVDGLKLADRLIEVVSLEVNRSLPLINVQMVIRSYYSPAAG